VRYFTRKTVVLCFRVPTAGGLGATHDVHLRLIGKRVSGDFLLVLTGLLCWVLRLRRYERVSTENRRFRSNGYSLTQNFT